MAPAISQQNPHRQVTRPVIHLELYLTANHDMSHFRLAIAALPFVITSADRENKISRVALALSYKKATMFSLLG
jgi:hypothetical protein